MTIEESNKLIAEFMGLIENKQPYNGSFSLKHNYIPSDFTSFIHDQMEDESWYVYPKFDRSWDWLMRVVEKIEKLKVCSIIIDGRSGCKIKTFDEKFEVQIKANKLTAVYNSVIEFIKWYNEQK